MVTDDRRLQCRSPWASLHASPAARTTWPSPAAPEPAADKEFPWLCFATTVTVLGGLYVLIRRREQAVEADQRSGHLPELAWYCRACDRDACGPACPTCGSPSPFSQDLSDADPGPQPAPRVSRPGNRGGPLG